jgi:hypothetical protein
MHTIKSLKFDCTSENVQNHNYINKWTVKSSEKIFEYLIHLQHLIPGTNVA